MSQHREAYELIRNGIIKGGGKIGNYVYNQNIPVLSELVGGMFHASEMEGKESTVSSTAGAFVNGVFGTGALGTVDGIVGIAADPYGALEGVNDIVRKPGEAVPVIWKEVKEYVNTNVIEGTAESRARVAGALAFEVLSAVITSGGTPAAKAAKVGDKAGELGRTARVSDRISDMGKTAKGLVTGKAEKLLTSPKVGKLADYMDDVLDGLCNKMGMRKTPWKLSPADAPISGIGDTKYFGQLYDDLLRKQALNESRNGVKINKAADLADDVGDAEKAAGKGIASEGMRKKIEVTPDLENHIKNVDQSVPRRRGIGGAHNSQEFF